MNLQEAEQDIQHLERIILHLRPRDALPLSYWRRRIERLSERQGLTHAHIDRLARLLMRMETLEAEARRRA